MSMISDCPSCDRPGRRGFDGDWCHEETPTNCAREGWNPDAEG